jgi:SAM-dependent methyltransferase
MIMSEPLAFTGERFTPECVREIWYEHMARYAMAAHVCKGARVLDVACGEGYGSHLLALVAAEVDGADIDAESVAHARGRYQRDNLRFHQADATALPFDDDGFDVITSFETLEHLEAQQALLKELHRVLRPGGVLLISSPDKHTYSDLPGFNNPYHVRELYREEFEDLLSAEFAHHRLYGQKLAFQSLCWRLDGPVSTVHADTAESPSAEKVALSEGLGMAPIYFIAACSDDAQALQRFPADLCLFADREESVYAHYQHEIRHNIMAGGVLQEREQRIAELEAQLAESQPPQGLWNRLCWLLGKQR